uniref:Uncharacterized protein n=1 Tax=Timema shepardi TaxID=629360 RepID=A0A7R9G098_TIMSH|nr:unnamed protein product [Timema shepardi]
MLEKKEVLPKSQSANLQVALLTSKLVNVEKQEWRIVVEENQRVNDKKIQQLQDNLSQVRAELESSQDMIQTLEEQKLPHLLKSESLINQNTLLLSKLECCENQVNLQNKAISDLQSSLKKVHEDYDDLLRHNEVARPKDGTQHVEFEWEKFKNILVGAAEEVCERTSSKRKWKRTPWWNDRGA